MIKEAIETIQKLADKGRAPPDIKVLDGRTRQSVGGDEYLPIPTTHDDPLQVSTLSAIIDYLADNRDALTLEDVSVIVTPGSVFAVTPPEKDGHRTVRISAAPALGDVVQPHLGKFLDQESLIVWLQTAFLPSPDRADLLKMVSSLQAESVRAVGDSGIAQEVVVKTGSVRVGSEVIKSPVMLIPRRTFGEITLEPEAFIVRAKAQGAGGLPGVALFAAGGDAWKLDAVAKIASYLKKNARPEQGSELVQWGVLA